jgi:hypothetical protein
MRDAERSHVHMSKPRVALFYTDWLKTKLEHENITVPPVHQPVNPDDDEDAVADQHAPSDIRNGRKRELRWKALGLKERMELDPQSLDRTDVEWPRFGADATSASSKSSPTNTINWTRQKIARS